MKRLILTTLLALSHGSVSAEWVTVERDYLSPGLQTLYIDPDTLHREENLVTIGLLVDFKWMQGNYVGTPRFLSVTARKQFDCTEKRLRWLAFTEYYGHMATGLATGGYVDKNNWLPVEPDSMNQALWEVACGKP